MPAKTTIPSKTLNHIEGETKIFHDKTKFTQYVSTNPASPTKDNRGKSLKQGGKLHHGKSKIVTFCHQTQKKKPIKYKKHQNDMKQ